MAHPENNPSLILVPDQVEALNSVDLLLAFGNHGYYIKHPEHGAMVLGISDKEFQDVDDFMVGMEAWRGDALAIEAIGYDKPWTPDVMVEGLKISDAYLPYLQSKTFEGLDSLDPGALSRYFRLARDLQITSPIIYAESKAVERGGRVVYADASAAEMEAWEGKHEINFRNERMVASLGKVATEMDNDNDERSQLRFIAGAGHRRGIERILTVSGVRYQSTYFGRQRRVTDTIFDAQAKAHIRLPQLIPSPAGRHIRAWERNLSSKNAEHN